MNKFKAIVQETYVDQVKSKSFIILLLLPIILIALSGIVGFISYQNASSSGNDDTDKIALIADNGIKQSIVQKDGNSIDSSIKTEQQAKQKLKNDDIYGYVKVIKNNGKYTAKYIGNETIDSGVRDDVMQSLSLHQNQLNLSNSNLTSEQIKKLSNKPLFDIHVKKQSNDNKSDDNVIKMSSLQVLIYILYFFLFIYSSITASVISKEKGSKLIEIIFSSTTSTNYFIGKITGIVLMMLTQFAAYLIMFFGSYFFLSQADFSKDFISENSNYVHQIIDNLVNINLVFIIFGLLLGIILAATAGSLVSRREDANKAGQPVFMLVVILFVLSMIFQNNSNNIIPKILSYFPLSSYFFMPIRMINNQANIYEGLISLVILIAFIFGLTYFISKVYKGLMLQNNNGGWFHNLIKGVKYR
ncbi:ABC transporter permease [Apilactobacillus timberlakei]|uniref:ABC transporter permease n=1 Tax=Apilactobacillus timberlakei TaxID=2008380 RepID=A0ABY2YRI6_9LACO|nr:ABC transporter permease [Apilactobacillus timberlakei]TPR12362.1 ABC transporter permease [Apilactobacillus timberlakei]TPR12871.1 ABC transporter permease [Apilactobacillus timberlakei]TPR14421.1 ABC transporter permease [Apilactobacillus timberlakei]